jgi:hypothetical protein
MTSYALCLCLIHYLQSLSILPIHNPADFPLRVREGRTVVEEADKSPNNSINSPNAKRNGGANFVVDSNTSSNSVLSRRSANEAEIERYASHVDSEIAEDEEIEEDPVEEEDSSEEESSSENEILGEGKSGNQLGANPRDPLIDADNDQSEEFVVTDVNSLSQLLQGFFCHYKRKAAYEHVIDVTKLEKENIPVKVCCGSMA